MNDFSTENALIISGMADLGKPKIETTFPV